MTKLFNTQRMQHFKPIRTEEMTRLVVAVWNDSSSHDIILHGGAQDVRMKLHVAASNVISRMTFGKSFEELSTTMRISGPAFCQTVYDSLKLMGAFDVNDFLPAFKFLDLQGFEQRAARVFQHLDVAIQRIVDDRRSNLRPSNHSNEKDFLDILLSSSTDEDVVKSSDSEPALSLTDDNIKAIVRVCYISYL
jgi:cytochrome P450